MKRQKSVCFKGINVYVAPANPAGRILAGVLEDSGAIIQGFVDNLKTGNNIINDPKLLSKRDYIIVAEGGYQEAICITLVQRGVLPNQIICVYKGGYNYFNYGWLQRFKNFLNTTSVLILSGVVNFVAQIFPSRRVVYYTEDFIDNNTLVAWQYHCTVSPKSAILITKNLSKITGNSYPILSSDTLVGKLALIRAKCIVIDHEYHGKLFDMVRRKRPSIQIFHGLPYKFLAGNKHLEYICDDVFISSSVYFNECLFPKLFRAERYLTLGYPRNDVFIQMPSERCWVNTPEYQKPQNIIEETGALWIYMPTYRDNGSFKMPFSLDEMQVLCEKKHRSLILKFHPFVAKQVILMYQLEGIAENIVALPSYPNIYLYPTRMNIYPWLADSELLITDYSSVAFDFLLTSKQTLFFQYDYDSYCRNRGAFTIPIEDFAAGPVVKGETEFFEWLAQFTGEIADTEKEKRLALRKKLKITTRLACPQVIELIREIT